MTIQQLHYFLTTADCGSFSEAGKKLHLTQAAISTSIRDLERNCGTPLFDRSRVPLALTTEGSQLYGAARDLLYQYRNVETLVDNLSHFSNTLQIGFTTIFGSYAFASLVSQFHYSNPDIHIDTEENSYGQLSKQLSLGQLDVVIAAIPPRYTSQFDSIPLFDDKLVFCANRNHPFAFREHLTLAELADEPLVILSERFDSSRNVLKKFSDQGLSPTIFHRTDQVYTVARFLEYNAAIGVYPLSAANQNPRLCTLAVEDYNPIPVSIDLLWNSHRQLSPCAQRFLQFARKQRKKYLNPIEFEKTDR